MWNKCKLWIYEAAVSLVLTVGVPAVFLWTGGLSLSVAPHAMLVMLGYAAYILNCVYARDMRRGLCAIADILKKRTRKERLTVQTVWAEHARYTARKGVFPQYYVMRCLDQANQPVILVSGRNPDVEPNACCTVTYCPLSKVVLDVNQN